MSSDSSSSSSSLSATAPDSHRVPLREEICFALTMLNYPEYLDTVFVDITKRCETVKPRELYAANSWETAKAMEEDTGHRTIDMVAEFLGSLPFDYSEGLARFSEAFIQGKPAKDCCLDLVKYFFSKIDSLLKPSSEEKKQSENLGLQAKQPSDEEKLRTTIDMRLDDLNNMIQTWQTFFISRIDKEMLILDWLPKSVATGVLTTEESNHLKELAEETKTFMVDKNIILNACLGYISDWRRDWKKSVLVNISHPASDDVSAQNVPVRDASQPTADTPSNSDKSSDQ